METIIGVLPSADQSCNPAYRVIAKVCFNFYIFLFLLVVCSIFATEWYFWGPNDTLGKRTYARYGGKRYQTYPGCWRRDNRGCHRFFAENGTVTEMADFRVGDSGPFR